MRFGDNCRSPKSERRHGPLTSVDLEKATHMLARIVQEAVFSQELQDLQNERPVNSKSNLSYLNPFIDEDSLIRAGGRLKNSTLNYSVKHPIILPANHHFTRLVIQHEDIKQLHSGTEGTLAAIRNAYWILSARNSVKDIRKCITYFRTKRQESTQIMGNFPKDRARPTKPFNSCGIDYFGPLMLKQGTRKNSSTTKAYGVVFVFFSTKAVHCELVTSLSSDAFIGSLKRLISRRGKVANIYTDNGTSFVGANRELKELRELVSREEHKNAMVNAFADDGIN